MASPEQTVVDVCVRELKRRNIISVNLNGNNGETGLPDRLALIGGGQVLAIEFKAPKTGRLSAKQRHVHDQWRAAGIEVLVVDDVKQLRAWLDGRVPSPATTTAGQRSPRARP